jgi:hypothetical protein
VSAKQTGPGNANGGLPSYHFSRELKVPVREGETFAMVSIAEMARWFSFADPDVATEFLCEVARQINGRQDVVADHIWHGIGFHLRYCLCATDEAREMVKRWAYWADCAEEPDGGTNPKRRKL